MHELSLTRSIVSLCAERSGGVPVLRVSVEVGALSCVMPEAMAYCYDICCKGTPLEGSRLEILRIPGRARCRQCGAETAYDGIRLRCVCGSRALDVIAGLELKVREMELADDAGIDDRHH